MDINQNGNVISRPVENFMSLRVAAEMSVKLLEESYPQDLGLLYFIACMPGGVSES